MNQRLSLEEDLFKIYDKELNPEFGLIKTVMIYIKKKHYIIAKYVNQVAVTRQMIE